MGCCVSKTDDPQHTKSPPRHLPVPESDTSRFKPLLPVLEEETVKEVLSETHTSKPKPKPKPKSEPNLKEEEEKKKPTTIQSLPPPLIEEEKKEVSVSSFNVAEEISEVSEICSLSESVSTTTITERKEDETRSREDGEVQQRVDRSPAKIHRKRSIPGEFASRTERGRKSPARKSEPSLGRGNDNAVKSVYGTEVGQMAIRRISGSNGFRQNQVERRRSRSPVTRTEPGSARPGLGRSPSRRGGRSPGRIPVMAPESGRKIEESKMKQVSANESLENPFVSLECFIFL